MFNPLRRSSMPSWVAALPFLFAPRQDDDWGWQVRRALAAAAAAENAVVAERRDTRARLAWLMCELGYQLGAGRDRELPVSRRELADALGTGLPRVKRTLALLALSGVAEAGHGRLRILDWRRLSALADYDPARLGLGPEEVAPRSAGESPAGRLTAAGDPACFT